MTAEERVLALASAVSAEVDLIPDPHPKWGVYGKALTLGSGARRIEVFGWDGGPEAYSTALHEIAHLELGHHDDWPKNYSPRILEAEAEAWEWAIERMVDGVKPALHEARIGLESYVRTHGTDTAGRTFSRVAKRVGLEIA